MIRKYWEKIRPSSTEYDPENSAAENESERLQCLNRRLKYKIKACLKNSRKQEKVINQLKLENEILNDEKQKELQASEKRSNKREMERQRLENENQNFENDLKEKEEKIQFDERENRKYKTNLQEKIKAIEGKNEALITKLKNNKNTNRKIFMLTLVGVAIATSIGFWQVEHGHAKELLSYDYENQKYKDDLQEKQKELKIFEEQLNRLEMDQQRLGNDNKNYKDDLQGKQKELQALEERLGKLETENRRLEGEKQNCENGLKNTQTKLQSRDRENQKYKNDLQEKVKAIEEQYNTFIKRELLFDGFNNDF